MALLRGSVEADVPIQFADREWSEFVWRSLYGSYAKGFEDVAASLSETDADSGQVTFENEGERLVKVSVEVEYTPRRPAPVATRQRKWAGHRRAWSATLRSTASFF